MNKLAKMINDAFIEAVKSSGNEVNFLKKFVELSQNKIQENNINNQIKFRSKFVHQKPYALFVDPEKINGKSRTELGDMLFVIKSNQNGVIQKKATFIQVKWNNDVKPSWKLERHQFNFWKNIKKNTFSFGKKVFKDSGYEDIVYQGISDSDKICNYLFVGKNNPISKSDPEFGLLVNINDLRCEYKFDQGDFILSCRKSFENGMIEILKGNCENVNGNLKSIMSIIYKYMQWEDDPPEEYEDYFLGTTGFAIFEIEVSKDVKENS